MRAPFGASGRGDDWSLRPPRFLLSWRAEPKNGRLYGPQIDDRDRGATDTRRLFSDHKDPVQGALSFGINWAQKLMRVASNHTVAKTEHAQHLPTDLETIYQLSLMSAPALEAAIEAGAVRPDMKRAEVPTDLSRQR